LQVPVADDAVVKKLLVALQMCRWSRPSSPNPCGGPVPRPHWPRF